MGKSTAARMMRQVLGIPVYDADAEVHRLYRPGGAAVQSIAAAFPEALVDNAIDRAALSRLVVGKPDALAELERLVHPLMRDASLKFLRINGHRRRRMVVMDIPLLFETRAERSYDAVMVVTAPAFLQRQRALARPGMTAQKFASIRDRQVPDRIKRKKADILVQTGLGRRHALVAVKRGLKALRRRPARAWSPARAAYSRR